MKIDHEYTDEIVCPHCGYEMSDSSFFNENWVHECSSCGEEFEFERNVTVTYTSYKKPCKEEEHQYTLKSEFIRKETWSNGDWVELPPEKHVKYNIYDCAICNKTKYEEI